MKKLYLFAIALMIGFVANADYYVIGSNVNGKSWSLKADDAKFTSKGNNIYEWTGSKLGTGFKINNGTWDNDAPNFGSNGTSLTPGTPYTMGTGGSSGNIAINGATEITNPKIVLDVTNPSAPVITVSGTAGGEIAWYLCGINGSFVADEGAGSIKLKPTANANELKSDEFQVTNTTGEFKIASTGWAKEYGQNSPVTISSSNMSATLEEVFGEAGNLPYNLAAGGYTCSFNLQTLVVTFASTGGGNQGGGDNPNPPTPPAGDSSVTWVNLGGPFNGDDYYNNGQQPDAEGIATFTNQAIGTSGFKVKTWNESVDVYYISETGTIATDQWVQLYEDIYDAPASTIEGAVSGNVYTVKFNVLTNQIFISLDNGGNGGDDTPNPPTPPTPGTDKNLYLVGSEYGNWALDTQYQFTQNGNEYTITLPSGVKAGEYGWKIFDGSWDYNFGCGEYQPELGVESEAWFDGGNFTIDTTTATTIKLTVVAGSDIKDSDIPSKILITAKGSGIDSLEAAEEGAIYYNLQGVRIENPSNGIFIRITNGKTSKVIK